MNFIYSMEKYLNKYRIEPNRWQFWDYSSPASYFITIFTTNRQIFLGYIKNGQMILSKYGEIVKNEFLKIPQYHPRIILDE
jgi:putative transposase